MEILQRGQLHRIHGEMRTSNIHDINASTAQPTATRSQIFRMQCEWFCVTRCHEYTISEHYERPRITNSILYLALYEPTSGRKIHDDRIGPSRDSLLERGELAGAVQSKLVRRSDSPAFHPRSCYVSTKAMADDRWPLCWSTEPCID